MSQEHQIVNLYTWVILSTKHRKKALEKSGFNGSGMNPSKSLDRFTHCCLVWYGLVCIAATTAWSSGIRLINAVGKTWEYHLRYFGCYNTTAATSFFSETQSGEKCHQSHLQLKMKRNQIEKGETRSSLGSDQCPFHQNWYIMWIKFDFTQLRSVKV